MGSKPDKNLATIFDFKRTRSAPITMLFMRYAIDIVWLDSKKRVLAIERNAKPWRLNIDHDVDCMYVIEVVAGEFKSVHVGDVLNWKESTL
jgi:uncharacterized membrane protein (UPF0127 family)